jgi:hypothetical protein
MDFQKLNALEYTLHEEQQNKTPTEEKPKIEMRQ